MDGLVYYKWRCLWTHEKGILAAALYTFIKKGQYLRFDKYVNKDEVIVCTGMKESEVKGLEPESELKKAFDVLDKYLGSRMVTDNSTDYEHIIDVTASYLKEIFSPNAKDQISEEISNALNTIKYLSNLRGVSIKLDEFSDGESICKYLGLIQPIHPGVKFCEILGFDDKSVEGIKIADIEKTIAPWHEININSSMFKEFLEGRAPMKSEYLECLCKNVDGNLTFLTDTESLWNMQFDYYLEDMKEFIRKYRLKVAQYSGTTPLNVCISILNQLAGEYLRDKNIEVKFGFVTDSKKVCCINIYFVDIFPITIDLDGIVEKDENTEYFSEFYYPD